MNTDAIIHKLDSLEDKMSGLIGNLGELEDCFQELKTIVKKVIVDNRFVKLDKAGMLLEETPDCLTKTIDDVASVLASDYVHYVQRAYFYMCGLNIALTEYKKLCK